MSTSLVAALSLGCESTVKDGAGEFPTEAASAAPPSKPAEATTPVDAAAEADAPPPPEEAASVEAPPPPPPPDPLDTPKLVDDDGTPLPQTEDRPSADSPAFKRRMEVLFEAIQKNEPWIADRVFFPVVAYEQVKAIEKPADDWNRRLMRAFARNIGEYHKKLGDNPDKAELVEVTLREPKVKWMKPHSEGNKVGYFRVTRNTLRARRADGKEIDLELTSLISWRGEWFVVHLNGFK